MQLSNALTSFEMGWGSESRKYTSPQLEHFTMKGIAIINRDSKVYNVTEP